MKKWLIIYDIRNEKRLTKAAKLISAYGMRVQKSVYELSADDDIIIKIYNKLDKIINTEDSVLYFELCDTDWKKRKKYGASSDFSDEKSFLML